MKPEDEIRITDPNTGGQKGQKIARFDLIPPDPLWQLAEVYGLGAQKYADDNWLKGYRWRLSIGALLRHVFRFIGGEYMDSESGKPHLAHAMFHCIALMEFHRLKRGTDDRQCTAIGAGAEPKPVPATEPVVSREECLRFELLESICATRASTIPKRKRVYIAGPMRGIRYYNFPAFDKAAVAITSNGYEPVNPAALDRDIGFDPYTLPADHDWSTVPPGFDMRACRKRDVEALETCQAIYMLDGWERSKGARAELAYAEWMGLEAIK